MNLFLLVNKTLHNVQCKKYEKPANGDSTAYFSVSIDLNENVFQ